MRAKITNSLIPKLAPVAKPYEVNDSDLKGFTLRVQPSGAMTYLVRYRHNGKQTRKTIGRATIFKAAEAREEARRILASVTMGENPTAAKESHTAPTLKVFLDSEYAPWVLTHRKDGEATVARLETCFSDFLSMPLCDILPIDVEKWRTARCGAGIKPSTINRDLTALKALLSKAVEWGKLGSHPLPCLKPLEVSDDERVRFLEADEEKRLREALHSREEKLRHKRKSANEWRQKRGYPLFQDLSKVAYANHLHPMVLLSLNTGLRRGEVFKLQWNKVDLARAMITVTARTAKNSRTRHVPLNEEALSTLKAWKAQAPHDETLVFPGPDGKPMKTVKSSWKKVIAAAEIVDFRWHDMRHHFASWLVMGGVDLNTVRELLGHADIKMTLRYAHLAPKHKAAAVAKLISPVK